MDNMEKSIKKFELFKIIIEEKYCKWKEFKKWINNRFR